MKQEAEQGRGENIEKETSVRVNEWRRHTWNRWLRLKNEYENISTQVCFANYECWADYVEIYRKMEYSVQKGSIPASSFGQRVSPDFTVVLPLRLDAGNKDLKVQHR